MFGATEKLRQYTTTLERAYSSLIQSYIGDTFRPCINNPKEILQWRYHTTGLLYSQSFNARRFTSPQQDVSDFLGLMPDIFPEPIIGSFDEDVVAINNNNGKTVPTQAVKNIDRQLCNYLRNQLAISDDDDTQLSIFFGIPKEQKRAIQDELDKPLEDYYNKQNNKE